VKTRDGKKMRLVCRKCGLGFDVSELLNWQEVDEIQRMTCGAGGTHRLVGRE